MTPPTFQELLTSQEARFTNEQLEAWAGLGPWCQPDGPEYGVMLDRVPSRPIHGFLGQPIFDKQPHDDWFEQEMANAALIAAAPAIAAALLAERKAREVEVGELKRLQAERDSAILWIRNLASNPHKPMTWMQTREAAADFVANLEAALAKMEESK